jgi:hypothetical protein
MEDHLDYMDKTMKSMGMKAEGEYEEESESEMED